MAFTEEEAKKLKVGDKVRLRRSGKPRRAAGWEWLLDNSVLTLGSDGVDDDGDLFVSDGGYVHYTNALPCEKTLDNLAVGDVLLTRNASEKTVLAELNGLVALSGANDPNVCAEWFTAHELRADGYTVKRTEPDQDTIELTLEEVAELKGVPVEKLRIKD